MKKSAKAPSRPSLIETIEQLKSYTEFESVTVGADGSVSVKYAARMPAGKKEKREAPQPKKTAIDSLRDTPPPFNFS